MFPSTTSYSSVSAIVLPETEDKRILFVVPWGSRAIFGTTDTGTGDIDHPRITHKDVVYLLKYLNRYLSVNLSEKDIVSTYAGYRPLVKPRRRIGRTPLCAKRRPTPSTRGRAIPRSARSRGRRRASTGEGRCAGAAPLPGTRAGARKAFDRCTHGSGLGCTGQSRLERPALARTGAGRR